MTELHACFTKQKDWNVGMSHSSMPTFRSFCLVHQFHIQIQHLQTPIDLALTFFLEQTSRKNDGV